jgi:hypothetical protein
MTWQTSSPAFDGDAPAGVTLDTHEIQFLSMERWRDFGHDCSFFTCLEYRYRPRATYEQVVAWCEANGRDVPAPPIDYEAWRGPLEKTLWSAETPLRPSDKTAIEFLIAAFKLAMTIPACREAIEG